MTAARLLPGLADLRRYERAWLRHDLVAGLTVAAYLIPQVMAYAGLAGLPPVTGLWATLAPLALYAVLGSSRLLSVGPESTTALMTAAAVAPLAGGDPARYAAIAAGVAVVVGLLSLVAFAARLGFVADLLSRPILVGYLAGVAVTMIVGQLSKLTGAPVDGAGVPAELLSFLRHLGQAHLPTVVFGGVSLALLFPGQRFLPRFPTPLFVVLLATAVVGVFDLQRYGLSVVGAVPPGLPTPALPTLADLRHLVLPAVGILVVGYTDTVLTARAFADPRGRPIDANQELLATGVANIGTGLLRGFPISSSGSRTALALASGARSQVYSLVALAAVVAILLVAGSLLARSPRSGAPNCCWRSRRWPGCSSSTSCTACCWRSACPSRTCCAASPGRTTACWASYRDWPGCTTSTTIHKRQRCRDSWSTGTTRRCSSPTRRTSTVARWRPSTGSGSRCAGSCSTYGLTARIGAERIYPTLPTAVAAYEKWRAEHDAG